MKYPEVFDFIRRMLKKGKPMHSLNDIYPGVEKKEAITKLREILNWTETLPISKIPYVEIGFDTLNYTLLQSLQEHNEYVQGCYSPVKLNFDSFGEIPVNFVY